MDYYLLEAGLIFALFATNLPLHEARHIWIIPQSPNKILKSLNTIHQIIQLL